MASASVLAQPSVPVSALLLENCSGVVLEELVAQPSVLEFLDHFVLEHLSEHSSVPVLVLALAPCLDYVLEHLTAHPSVPALALLLEHCSGFVLENLSAQSSVLVLVLALEPCSGVALEPLLG